MNPFRLFQKGNKKAKKEKGRSDAWWIVGEPIDSF
jgi:hypothetical protein